MASDWIWRVKWIDTKDRYRYSKAFEDDIKAYKYFLKIIRKIPRAFKHIWMEMGRKFTFGDKINWHPLSAGEIGLIKHKKWASEGLSKKEIAERERRLWKRIR